METTVKTAEDVAKDFIASNEKVKESKANEEAKAAELKSEEQKKVEAQDATKGSLPEDKKPEVKSKMDDVVGDAEKAAEDNIRILEAKEADLSDEDKAKRKELITKQEAKKAEATEKEGKSNVEKRIGELTGQVKDLKRDGTSDKETIAKLQTQIDDLQKESNATPEQKAKEELKKVEDDRIAKYAEEDKDLPRDERREMSRDDLEEWLLEDIVSANEWMTDRLLRRRDESAKDKASEDTKSKVTEILKQQKDSEKRMMDKHPALKDAIKRRKELSDEGKNDEDINKIVLQENPTVRAFAAVMRSMTPKENEDIQLAPDGPEKLMRKVEKYMADLKPTKKTKEETPEETEEREQEIANEAAEAERQRMADLDASKSSTRTSPKAVEQSDQYKQQLAVAKKSGISEERLKEILARRKKIPGLG